MYVLSEGEYPNLSSIGCTSNVAVRSVKVVPLVRNFSNTSEKLFGFSSLFCSEPSSPLLLILLLHLDFRSSLHLPVWPGGPGGQRDHHRDWDKQHGRGGFQQPHPVCQSQQRQVCLSLCVCVFWGECLSMCCLPVCIRTSVFALTHVTEWRGSFSCFYESQVVQTNVANWLKNIWMVS